MQQSGTSDLDVTSIVAGLRRNLWLVALCSGIGLSMGYIYAYHIADVTYRASASLVVRPLPSQLAQGSEASADGMLSTEEINTERSILVSKTNLRAVVAALNLVEDPEFNSQLDEDVEFPDEEARNAFFMTAALDSLQEAVRAETVPGTMVIRTTVESESPGKAQAIANSVVDQYISRIAARAEAERRATIQRLSQTMENLQEQLVAVETEIADFQFGSSDPLQQTRDTLLLERLGSEANAIRALHENVIARFSEFSIDQGTARNGGTILDSAEMPLEPYRPRHKLILASSLLIGGFIGICLALLRDSLSDRVRGRNDLVQLTGRQVIAAAAVFRRSKRFGSIRRQFGLNQPANIAALEDIRGMIRHGADTRSNPQIIAVVSGMPEEGKTALAVGLAVSYADAGLEVLLVDTDMRRRALSKVLAPSQGLGLVSVLSDATDLQTVVVRADALGVDLLVSEAETKNALDLVASKQFGKLIETARKNYDVIIMDTPPMMAAFDARAVTKIADFVLYVARQDETRSRHVVETLSDLNTIGETVDAFVLATARLGPLEGARKRLRKAYASRPDTPVVQLAPTRSGV